MIVTLTPNPSIDRTITLSEPLVRGEVIRSTTGHDDPGGKGVNVAQVVRNAGQLAVAVLPGDHDDPLLVRLRELRLTHRAVPTGLPSRINITLAEPDGVTTKINAPARRSTRPTSTSSCARSPARASAPDGRCCRGRCPSGVDLGWYADVIAALADDGLAIALDTSGEPLRLAVERVPASSPCSSRTPRSSPTSSTPTPSSLDDVGAIVDAARPLLDAGVGAVLLTRGSRGAVLLTTDGTWTVDAPPVQARSTVGAGDSALAGYLLGALDGLDPAKRLTLAVAYGSAAASLPGSTMPSPADLPPLTEARRWNEG